MKLSRDTLLSLALVVVLFVVTVLAAATRSNETPLPALHSASTAPEGARALALWLDELGYFVDDSVGAEFEVPAENQSGLILVLEPAEFVTPNDWQQLEDTLTETGGTLIVAGDSLFSAALFERFDFQLQTLDTLTNTVTPVAPLFTSPPLTQPVTTQARAWLSGLRAHTPLLTVGEKPVAVAFPLGRGRVILTTLTYAFSNLGLKEPGHAELVLNLLGSAATQWAWFDEWHHGERAEAANPNAIVGPEAWLQRTPAGQALLFCALIIFVALLLRGQSFGRPVPLPRDLSRRAPLEYITAIANLSRRAGHREAALNDYSHRLKRHLGKRYRLDPTVRDPEFVARLAQYKPDLDKAALNQLLARLRQPNVSEAELIRLAGEVAMWTRE